jgi:hypothetical protein
MTVVHRAHVADYGWMQKARNGEVAGTTRENRRMEGIVVHVRGGDVPGDMHVSY